jgi:hypothetical protein
MPRRRRCIEQRSARGTSSSPDCSGPRGFSRSGEQFRLAFVPESEALAINADDDRVVEDAIEHRHSEHTVAGEGSLARLPRQCGVPSGQAAEPEFFAQLNHTLMQDGCEGDSRSSLAQLRALLHPR